MTEQLELWTCNSEASSSSPTLITCWFFLASHEFKSLTTLANSQLVCLWPIRILNPFTCTLDSNLFVSGLCLAPLALVL